MDRAEISSPQELIALAVAPKTRQQYLRGVEQFDAFCRQAQLTVRTASEFDSALSAYITTLYQTHGSRSAAITAVCGLKLFRPQLRHALPIADACLRGWKKADPPQESYPPLSWDLACLIAVDLLGRRQPLYALCVLLSFDCMLRTVDLAQIVPAHIAYPQDPRLSGHNQAFGTVIPTAKTGPNQWVQVRSSHLSEILRTVLPLVPPHEPLLPGPIAKFRDAFHASAAHLGLRGQYQLHSLRHGGATALFLQGVPAKDIAVAGRWRSLECLMKYIQAGRNFLLQQAEDPATITRARAIAEDISSYFMHLPVMGLYTS